VQGFPGFSAPRGGFCAARCSKSVRPLLEASVAHARSARAGRHHFSRCEVAASWLMRLDAEDARRQERFDGRAVAHLPPSDGPRPRGPRSRTSRCGPAVLNDRRRNQTPLRRCAKCCSVPARRLLRNYLGSGRLGAPSQGASPSPTHHSYRTTGPDWRAGRTALQS